MAEEQPAGLMGVPLDSVLADASLFPHQLDLTGDRLTLVPTTVERLRALAFIDGRETFAVEEPVHVRLSDALSSDWPPPAGPDRMIFHMAFCGSTLLATLLDVPGQTLALREPNVLVALADERAAGRRPGIEPVLALVRGLLRRQWSPGEQAFCKPSNWANLLLPDLTATPETLRPVFITIDAREYLRSVFRGGRERLAFVMRSAVHFQTAFLDARQALLEAVEDADPLGRAARMTLLAHALQARLIAEAQERGGWGERHRIAFEQVDGDPFAAALQANAALGLELPAELIQQQCDSHLRRNAKQRGAAWSRTGRDQVNDAVEAEHGTRFDQALRWAESLPG